MVNGKLTFHPALGYKIVFLKSDYTMGTFYVPCQWFNEAGGRGEIVWGDDPAYPSFTVFYVDGTFSHIRLYVFSNIQHTSWGMLKADASVEKSFDIDSLEIDY